MRKVFLFGFLALIIMVGGLFAVSWYLQSSAAKEQVEKAVNDFNSRNPDLHLSYASVTTSGFPMQVNVAVNQPHITGRVDQFLQKFFATPPATPTAAPAVAPAMPAFLEWSTDIASSGSIIFGINAMADSYTLHSDGNWTVKDKINGQDIQLLGQMQPLACTLKIDHSGGLLNMLWNADGLYTTPEGARQQFRSIDCSQGGYSFTQMGKPIVTAGMTHVAISHTPQGAAHQGSIQAEINDLQYTPEGDQVYNAYGKAFSPNSLPQLPSLLGKQSMKIDANFNLPNETANLLTMPFSVAIRNVSTSNQAYSFLGNAELTAAGSADNRQIKLALHSESTALEPYRELQTTVVKQIVGEFYASDNPQLAPLKAMLEKYSQEQVFAMVKPAIPDMVSLGKTVFTLNADYQGNPASMQGKLNVSDAEISFVPYGMKANGTLERNQANPAPLLNATLYCTNCTAIISDGAHYWQRFTQALSYFDPQSAANFALPAEFAPAMIEVAGSAGKQETRPDGADVWSFAFTSDATGQMLVNNKAFSEVVAAYQQRVGSAKH